MQQLACHLLSTAVAAASTTSPTTTIAAATNYMGQSKILHLLGPPWTRTFRCIWMLEEINEEYYQQQQHQITKGNDSTAATTASNDDPTAQYPLSNVPYYLIYNAKPLSIYVNKFHSTGKVPVLLEYHIHHPPPQQQQQQHDDDDTTYAGASTGSTILDDQNVFVLSEASAINTYLYDQYGLYSSINNRNTRQGVDSIQPSLTNQDYPLVPPVGSPLRGQYDALISCICTELDAQGLWMHRKHDVMSQQLTGTRPNPRAVFHAKEHFKRINTYLAYLCNPYLLGAHFTAADILYIHCLQWSQSIGWSKDTWPTVDVSGPINVDAIKEQLRKAATDPSNSDSDLTASPPSILQPYLDLCLSRPAYQRAVQIRDGRGDVRKDASTNKSSKEETSKPTTSLLEQWELDQNNVRRRKNSQTPKSKL